jgi:hypothetical protein
MNPEYYSTGDCYLYDPKQRRMPRNGLNGWKRSEKILVTRFSGPRPDRVLKRINIVVRRTLALATWSLLL